VSPLVFKIWQVSEEVIKTEGKEWEQLFDKENFKIGAKFSPDIEVEEYKL